MNVEFKEEYWENALGVLEREERLERRKKFLPWIFVVSIVGAIALSTFLSWYLPASDATQSVAQLDVLNQDHRAHTPINSPIHKLELSASSIDKSSATLNKTKTESNVPLQNEVKLTASENSIHSTTNKRQAQMPQSSSDNSSSTQLASHKPVENQGSTSIEDESAKNAVAEQELTNTPSYEEIIQGSILAAPQQDLTFADQQDRQNAGLNLADHEDASTKSTLSKISPKSAQLSSGVKAQLKFRGFDYHAPFPFKVNTVYAFVGNSFLTGFGSRKNELAFNPEVGLGYEHVLGKRWSANASLSYFQIGGITHAAEFSETELGFGFNRTVTTVETSKLHFAYLPVMASWDFNKRNALSLGIGVSALINGISEVTVTEINDFSENQISKTSDWGYTQGYRTFNASLLAGYEFRLTGRLTFGLHYQHGLREITKANVYGGEFQDRNSRLRALIKYNFR